MQTLRRKCTCTCACAPGLFKAKASGRERPRPVDKSDPSVCSPSAVGAGCHQNYCKRIFVQTVVCRPSCCYLDEISCSTLFAQEVCPNPRQLMTRSPPLRCRTSIIRSSALVQTSSRLFMVCTRHVVTGLTSRGSTSPSF